MAHGPVMLVAGARPNFMKVAPLLHALEGRGVEVQLVHTGQHYDEAMSQVFFDELGLRRPDHHLNVGSGTHAQQTARVMVALEPLVDELAPAFVVTVGDVNSTLAASLVAAKAGVGLCHVEAGLRSRDWTMPEEVNRVVADRLAGLLFAPSQDAVANLEAEGFAPAQIHLVGNVMIDTLLACAQRAASRPTLADLGLRRGEYGVVTLHRPANVDDPAVLARLVQALDRVHDRCPLVFPAHPRTLARLESGGLRTRMRVISPVGYLDSLALQAGAALVLTDSGGLQEETTALGVPCLTLRENTERPITVTEGTNRVVGTDPAVIEAAAHDVLDHGVEPRRPALWDGRASERIADVLETALAGEVIDLRAGQMLAVRD